MGKMGSICHFPCALPASIWGHCSQVRASTSIWGTHTKRGVTMTLFILFFPASGYLETPKDCKTRENAKSACAIPIYRSLHTPEPRNPQKVSKRTSQASPSGVSKKSPNTDFVVFLTPFRVIWHFFDTFLTLQAGRPGNAILRLFGDFGPRAPRDSCIWRLQSQRKITNRPFFTPPLVYLHGPHNRPFERSLFPPWQGRPKTAH